MQGISRVDIDSKRETLTSDLQTSASRLLDISLAEHGGFGGLGGVVQLDTINLDLVARYTARTDRIKPHGPHLS